MKWEKSDKANKYILNAFVAALVVNLASNYFGEKYKWLPVIAASIIALILGVWISLQLIQLIRRQGSPNQKADSEDTMSHLVPLGRQEEAFGWGEIGIAFLFSFFLSGVNIYQRYNLHTSAEGLTDKDVVTLNVTMGVSAFFLTATMLLFVSKESEKISLFVKGIARRIVVLYLLGLGFIEVVSHFDTVKSFNSSLLMLAFSHLMFFSVSVVETMIDLQIAACFKKVSNHYKEYAEIYMDAGKWALWTLAINFGLSLCAILAYLHLMPNVDGVNTLLGMTLINLYFLLSIRAKIIRVGQLEEHVQSI